MSEIRLADLPRIPGNMFRSFNSVIGCSHPGFLRFRDNDHQPTWIVHDLSESGIRFTLVGWCPGEDLAFRPKDDGQVAVMAETDDIDFPQMWEHVPVVSTDDDVTFVVPEQEVKQ